MIRAIRALGRDSGSPGRAWRAQGREVRGLHGVRGVRGVRFQQQPRRQGLAALPAGAESKVGERQRTTSEASPGSAGLGLVGGWAEPGTMRAGVEMPVNSPG